MCTDNSYRTTRPMAYDSVFENTVCARHSGFSYLREDDLFDLLGKAGHTVIAVAVAAWQSIVVQLFY